MYGPPASHHVFEIGKENGEVAYTHKCTMQAYAISFFHCPKNIA
jgi:hypothetical protein